MKFYILLIIAFIALNLSADEPTKIRIKIKNQITEFKIYGTEKEVISALQEKCTKLGVNVIYRPFINSPAEPPILDDLDSGEDDPFAESNDPLAEEIDVQITSKFHKFNFDLKNISILQLVRYITIATGLKYKIDDHAIVIASPRITGHPNTIHLYEVTKEIVFLAKTYAESEVAITDSQVDKLYWQALGVNFYSGASIAYLPNVNKLVMTNYESEHRRLKELLEELKARLLFEQKPKREFLKDRSLSEYKINFPKIRFQKETFGNAIALLPIKLQKVIP